MTYLASCNCGAVQAACEGEPVRTSVCHCHACQKRSGSVFAAQVRFPKERVTLSGETREWQRTGDEGGVGTFRFCPNCGATIWYTVDGDPETIAVALGAFAGSGLDPTPVYSVYEGRKRDWVEIVGDGIAHYD